MVKHIYKKNHPHNEIEHYEVLILGGGPAGLTAALYASRYNLKTAVIAKSIGGTANLAGQIENWPGFIGSGSELMGKFKKQAEQFGARFLESEIDFVKKDENGFVVEIEQGDEQKVIHGKALIIALGTENRKLDLKGEKEFLGKGVSYCVTCDGMFFKDKTVAVIGGADSAAKAALYMSELAKKVYVIYRKNEMRCEPISLKKIEKKPNIKIHYQSIITKIKGKNKVGGIEIEKFNKLSDVKGEKIKIPLEGIFIEIGATPVGEVIRDLKIKTNGGHIITNKEMKTSSNGIFAAGDNTNNKLKQIVTAAGEGALAAKSAYDYLRFEYKE